MKPSTKTLEDQVHFPCIAFAWCLTAISHILTFTWMTPSSISGSIYLATTILLILCPACPIRFLAFLIATELSLFLNYEVLANHLVLEFWISTSILFFILFEMVKLRRIVIDPEDLYQKVAPIIRLQYILLYCFALFSKLNTDFFNPQSSCAAIFANKLFTAFGLSQLYSLHSVDIATIATYGTLLAEFSIPILLIFRRARNVGILAAMFFHLIMGLVPILGISSFSALSFTLLLFFLPNHAVMRLETRRTSVSKKLPIRPTLSITVKFVAVGVLLLTITVQHYYFHPSATFSNTIWFLVSAPFLWIVASSIYKSRDDRSRYTGKTYRDFVPKPVGLLFLVSPVIILGTLPYLGLQTQGSFTMFSNLRIIGEQTNHLFAKESWQLSKPTLVKIIGSNHPQLKTYPDSQALITEHEIRRKATDTADDYYILCEYKGQVVLIGRFQGELTPHPLLEPLANFPQSLIRFRDVSTNKLCECVW